MSFEVILPFLRPIEHLIRDGEISEIMVNGSGRIYIEKHGELLPIPDASISEKSLQVAVRNIARTLGDEVNDEMPLLDARLPDGSRVAAAIPPCSRRGTTLTIRKFQSRRFTPEELVRIGTVPQMSWTISERRSGSVKTHSYQAVPEVAKPRCSMHWPRSSTR